MLKNTIDHYRRQANEAFDTLQVIEETFGRNALGTLLDWYINNHLEFEDYANASEGDLLIELGLCTKMVGNTVVVADDYRCRWSSKDEEWIEVND